MTDTGMFFDKLETYFDYRDATPKNFSPTSLENLARDLVQMCEAVRSRTDRVESETHRAMIAMLVGKDSTPVKAWGLGGYKLNTGARELACSLRQHYDFPEDN